jgi:hypothetical protein
MSSPDFSKWTDRRRMIEKKILRHDQIIHLRMNQDAKPPRVEARVMGADRKIRPCVTAFHKLEDLFDGLEAWGNGGMVQFTLPFMSTEDREFLITGMSAQDWKETFG